MKLKELVSEGPIYSFKKNWDKGADAVHKLVTPSRWTEPSGSTVSAPAQKKSPTSTLGITRANKTDALAILDAVDDGKLSPSQQQLKEIIKRKIEQI
jgi:hypothetical protein